jgi:hypothetical protein
VSSSPTKQPTGSLTLHRRATHAGYRTKLIPVNHKHKKLWEKENRDGALSSSRRRGSIHKNLFGFSYLSLGSPAAQLLFFALALAGSQSAAADA